MPRKKLRFAGSAGELAGTLELPSINPRGFALFAHCFSCSKDSIAAARISRALADRGIAVLRFDFTGIGDSEGDFPGAGFSSNLDDLVAAADFLRKEFEAPDLLIGHSLGGTAVLAAAERIPESRAVVTIGAPASPVHIITHLIQDESAFNERGYADVTLGGQAFRLDRAFVEDLRSQPMAERIRGLRRALLVMHSPVDATVPIAEASEIFQTALHPKSFISLDTADHLLSSHADAGFVADTIAGWAARYVADAGQQASPPAPAGNVIVTEKNHRFLRQIRSDEHAWLSDEPTRVGGDDAGPDPYELLLAALGSCTSMTIRMYANHKNWPLDDVQVRLWHERDHGPDCQRCEESGQTIDVIHRQLLISGDLDDGQRQRLIEIADRCPVHKTLTGTLAIETELNPG